LPDVFFRVTQGVAPGLIDIDKVSLWGNTVNKISAVVKQAGVELCLLLERSGFIGYGGDDK